MTESNPPPPPPEPAPSSPPVTPDYQSTALNFNPDKDARLWGMLCHLSALAGFVGLPLGNILGPLIVWLIKKNEIPFADDQGKESLNFQISVMIAALLVSPTICLGIGIFLLIGLGVVALVFAIIGAVKANNGETYRYPFALRLIK